MVSILQFSITDYVMMGKTSNAGIPLLFVLAILTNLFFLVDLIANFLAFGCNEIIKRHKTLFYEVILQIIGIIAILKIIFGDEYDDVGEALYIFCLIFLFRTLRLMYLLTEFK